jgi:hypothetical protein
MSFTLGDILKREGLVPREKTFSEYEFGWLAEKRLWKKIEPRYKRGWKLKDHRPFMVVKEENDYVYFILFTSSPFRFPCDKDREYGIEEETPEIDLGVCRVKDDGRCNSLRGGSKLFKRFNEGSCKIVLRIKGKLLEENSYRCGKCDEKDIPENVRTILERELREWKGQD